MVKVSSWDCLQQNLDCSLQHELRGMVYSHVLHFGDQILISCCLCLGWLLEVVSFSFCSRVTKFCHEVPEVVPEVMASSWEQACALQLELPEVVNSCHGHLAHRVEVLGSDGCWSYWIVIFALGQ